MAETSYYDILGLSMDADSMQIKKAYREAARKYHPDLNKSQGAEELFKIVQEAYEVLIDEDKRMEYDQQFSREQSRGESSEQYYSDEGHYEYNQNYEYNDEVYEPEKRGFDLFRIIRIILGIFVLVVVPMSLYVDNPGLASNLILYYATIALIYAFTSFIFGLVMLVAGLMFISGVFTRKADQIVSAVVIFVVASIVVFIVRPDVFDR